MTGHARLPVIVWLRTYNLVIVDHCNYTSISRHFRETATNFVMAINGEKAKMKTLLVKNFDYAFSRFIWYMVTSVSRTQTDGIAIDIARCVLECMWTRRKMHETGAL